MARSLKKGPFVDSHLIKKVMALTGEANKASKAKNKKAKGGYLTIKKK